MKLVRRVVTFDPVGVRRDIANAPARVLELRRWRGLRGGGGRKKQQQRQQNPQRRERIERENEGAEEFLQKLSETTAGRFYESKASKFKDTFALIVDELRHQYRLGYYPPEETAGAAVHDLKVKVVRPNLVVRARSSYRPRRLAHASGR